METQSLTTTETELSRPFREWNLKNCDRPVTIAGPCSAETEEQVMETAAALKEQGIEIFRAGVWKPRTRPNSFEGVGSEALKWLQRVQKELGMKTAVEVANVKHVYEALRMGVDIFWIGARTSANPFAVQEIADALTGVDIPVMIKNPINPDVNLWIGAVERIQAAGIKKTAAIHRGFSSSDKSHYRNKPEWQIAIEFRQRMPETPMICDPSHIGGRRDILEQISQKAMDLNFEGLIIETHRNPDEAWSDAKQQLTPKALKNLLNNLVVRKTKPDSPALDTLETLRRQIDQIDNELLIVLQERMQISKAIGEQKKARNITILQSDRWKELLEKRLGAGNNLELSDNFISDIFTAVHRESINAQSKIMNRKTE